MSSSNHIFNLSFGVNAPRFGDSINYILGFEKSFNNSMKNVVRSAQVNMTQMNDIIYKNIQGMSASLQGLEKADLRPLKSSIYTFVTGVERGKKALEDTTSEVLRYKRELKGVEAQENLNYQTVLKIQKLREKLSSKDANVKATAEKDLSTLKALTTLKYIHSNTQSGGANAEFQAQLPNLIQTLTANISSLPQGLQSVVQDMANRAASGGDIANSSQEIFKHINMQELVDPMVEELSAIHGDVIDISAEGKVTSRAEDVIPSDAENAVAAGGKKAAELEELQQARDAAVGERASGKNRQLMGEGTGKLADALKAKDLKGIFGGFGDILKGGFKSAANTAVLSGGKEGNFLGKMFGGLGKVFDQFSGIMKLMGPFMSGFMGIFKLLMDAQAQQKEWNAAILEGASYLDLGAQNGDELNGKLEAMRDSLSQIKFNLKYLTDAKEHLAVLAVFQKYGHSFEDMTKGLASVKTGARGLVDRFQGMAQNIMAFSTAFSTSFVEMAEAQAKAAEEMGASLFSIQQRFYDIYKASQMSGFGAKRFYSMVSQLSSQLQGYNVRWAQLSQMVVKFSKVLAPEAAQAFIQKMATYYGEKGVPERMKSLILMGKNPTAGAAIGGAEAKRDSADKLGDFIRAGANGVAGNKFIEALQKAFTDAGLSDIGLKANMSEEELAEAIGKISKQDRVKIAEIASSFEQAMGGDKGDSNAARGLKRILNEALGATGHMTDVLESMAHMGPGSAMMMRLKQSSAIPAFNGKLPHEILALARKMDAQEEGKGSAHLEAYLRTLDMDLKTFDEFAEITARAAADFEKGSKEALELQELLKSGHLEDSPEVKALRKSLFAKGLGVDKKGNLREARGLNPEDLGSIVRNTEDMVRNDAKFNEIAKTEKDKALEMASEQMWATKDISAALDIIIKRIMELISQAMNIGNFAKGIFGWITGPNDAEKATTREKALKKDEELQAAQESQTEATKQAELARALGQLKKVIGTDDMGAIEIARQRVRNAGGNADSATSKEAIQDLINKAEAAKDAADASAAWHRDQSEKYANTEVKIRDDIGPGLETGTLDEQMSLRQSINQTLRDAGLEPLSDQELNDENVGVVDLKRLLRGVQYIARTGNLDPTFNRENLGSDLSRYTSTDLSNPLYRGQSRYGSFGYYYNAEESALITEAGMGSALEPTKLPGNNMDLADPGHVSVDEIDAKIEEYLRKKYLDSHPEVAESIGSQNQAFNDLTGTDIYVTPPSTADIQEDERVRNQVGTTKDVNAATIDIPKKLAELKKSMDQQTLVSQVLANPDFEKLDPVDKEGVLSDIFNNGPATNLHTPDILKGIHVDDFYLTKAGELFSFPNPLRLIPNGLDTFERVAGGMMGSKPGGFFDSLLELFRSSKSEGVQTATANTYVYNTFNGVTNGEQLARIIGDAIT